MGLGRHLWGLGSHLWGFWLHLWFLGLYLWGLGLYLWGFGSHLWGLGLYLWGFGAISMGFGGYIYGVWGYIYGVLGHIYGVWGYICGVLGYIYGVWGHIYGVWGYICGVLGYIYGVLAGAVGRAAARWAVGAALGTGAPCWLGDALDAATGRCWARGVIHGGTLLLPYSDPQSCRSHGHRWEGFGVSPQAFALVHCGLGLAEEVGALGPKRPGTALSLLFLLNVALIPLWHFLLAVTLTYRHDWPRNAAGAAIGWASWAITYRCWYRYPWSPGPPGLGLPAP
uniref:Fat storage inducing transmembrane protein 1 n=1 Tax=Strigops habroptila TaxID=2489341 RepID=A0A672UNU1_STRHB